MEWRRCCWKQGIMNSKSEVEAAAAPGKVALLGLLLRPPLVPSIVLPP